MVNFQVSILNESEIANLYLFCESVLSLTNMAAPPLKYPGHWSRMLIIKDPALYNYTLRYFFLYHADTTSAELVLVVVVVQSTDAYH